MRCSPMRINCWHIFCPHNASMMMYRDTHETYTHTDQNASHVATPLPVHTTRTHACTHTCVHLLSSCYTFGVSDPYLLAIKFIFVLQIDSLIYSVLLCSRLSPDLGWAERRKHSVITFYSFIPPQQWCCHPEMAPLCYSLTEFSTFFVDCLS